MLAYFLAALAANALTVLIIYLAVAYHRGSPLVQTGANVITGITNLGWRVVQLYIALLFLGGIAYAVKLLVLG